MGYKLRAVPTSDGGIISEKACENYKCTSCGRKMISVNFVNGACVQVFVTHETTCECHGGRFEDRTVEVTCETCEYYDESNQGCSYGGPVNVDIAKMHF